MTEVSNTDVNTGKVPGGPFRKGDPRINRKGRPKSFDGLRSLAQEIAHEAAKQSKEQGGQPVVIDGHIVSITEAIMRSWAMSKDPRLQQKFIEVAYGQVPSVTRLEGTLQQTKVTVYIPDNGRETEPAHD